MDPQDPGYPLCPNHHLCTLPCKDPPRSRNLPCEGLARPRPVGLHGPMTTSAAPLLSANTLVVDQKTKIFEMKNQYRIYDESKQLIGSIEQVGQGILTFLARLGSDYD